MKKKYKKILSITIVLCFLLWITLSSYLYFSGFDFERYFQKVSFDMTTKIGIVLILYFFRNYLLIPSTILILFSWFFLQDFWVTLIVSIIWVSFGICQTYFVWYVFWEDLKSNKNFKLISKYNDKIEADGFKIIFIGSFFPVIPVDILYYSAWFVKYHFIKTYFAGIIWEMPLIILYVYLWKEAKAYSDYFLYIGGWMIFIYILYLSIKKLFLKK